MIKLAMMRVIPKSYYIMTSEGQLGEYLGVEIVKIEGSSFEIKQHHPPSRLLKAVNINPVATNFPKVNQIKSSTKL